MKRFDSSLLYFSLPVAVISSLTFIVPFNHFVLIFLYQYADADPVEFVSVRSLISDRF